MGMGAHNLTNVCWVCHDVTCPYPSCVEVYTLSNMADCEDEFKDLVLNDCILAQRRVACQCLDRLELSKNQRALLARGVACMMDVDDNKNSIVEVCVGYASAVRVMVIDEMANVNEWVWFICLIIIDDESQFNGFDQAIGNHC